MTSIASRLNKHFVACAAAAAGAAFIGAVDKADAAVVWSGIVNINIPYSTAGIYLNVANGATGPSSTLAGWDVNPWGATNLSFFNPGAPAGGVYVRANTTTGGVSNLAVGHMIDGASLYTSGTAQTSGTNPFVLNSSNNLVGFRFQHEGLGGVRYGWMRLSLGSSLSSVGGTGPRTIVEYAYEDQAGVGIQAGIVPAPGALALLGLAGLAGSRRRRA